MTAPAAKPAELPTHTPGPWVLTDAFGRENPEGPLIGPSGANPIASLTGYYGVAGRRQNGALLVAAPDLLEALRNGSCPRPANAAPDYLTVEQCMARGECGCDSGAAIAKATGAA